jgi:hypothetical protein
MKARHTTGRISRLDALKLSRPEHAKKVVALLKKSKEDRKKSGEGDSAGSPSKSWNKKRLLEFAAKLNPEVEIPKNWTKQDLIDYIENPGG